MTLTNEELAHYAAVNGSMSLDPSLGIRPRARKSQAAAPEPDPRVEKAVAEHMAALIVGIVNAKPPVEVSSEQEA